MRRLALLLSLLLASPAWAVTNMAITTGGSSTMTVLHAATTSQLILGGSSSTPSNSATKYSVLTGDMNSTGFTLATGNQLISAAGTIDRLVVDMFCDPDNGAGVQSWAITLMKNQVATALTVTISEGAQRASDLTNAVAVAAGDEVELEWAPTNTPAACSVPLYSVRFVPTTLNNTLFLGTSNGALQVHNLYYSLGAYNSVGQSTIGLAEYEMPTAGTFQNLYLSKPDMATEDVTWTLYKNGSATALTCSITSGTTCNDTANSVTVVAGDQVALSLSSASGNHTRGLWGVTFVPTVEGEFVLAMTSSDALNSTFTEYNSPTTTGGTWSSLSLYKQVLAQPLTITALDVQLSGGTGVGNTYTFTLYARDTIASALSCVVTSGASANCSATGSIDVANGFLLSTESVPFSLPTARTAQISYVAVIPTTMTIAY